MKPAANTRQDSRSDHDTLELSPRHGLCNRLGANDNDILRVLPYLHSPFLVVLPRIMSGANIVGLYAAERAEEVADFGQMHREQAERHKSVAKSHNTLATMMGGWIEEFE